MAIREAIDAMIEQLACCQEDATKFEEKGNDAAGRRIRRCLMDISKASKELRAAIQEERNARKG